MLISNYSASILKQYSLACSEVLFENTYRKNLYHPWNSLMISRRAGVTQFAQNYLIFGVNFGWNLNQSDWYSAYLSWLVYTFSSKSDDILILALNCINIGFRCRIYKYQCQICIQQLQIDWRAVFENWLACNFPQISI